MEHPTQMMVESTMQKYFYDEYVNLTDDEEPQSFQEAIEIDDKEEMQSLVENQAYDLVELPKRRKALRNKRVFKLKNEDNNSNQRYKTRIMVKGCNQKKDIDFEEIFSPMVKMTSIRAILRLSAKQDLEVEQLDVKMKFFHW